MMPRRGGGERQSALRRLWNLLRRPRSLLTPAADESGLYRAYVRNALADFPADDFTPLADSPPPQSDVRLIAYYLPQFHPIPENNRWWGEGFTEWRNVARAFPVFDGHYQPRVPGELGYYDLRLVEVMRRQVELAKLYGISAFCFHHYWFQGRRLLERPAEAYLANRDLDLPFCLCWANESWSRRWSGSEKDVLMAQEYSPDDDVAFIRDLDRSFRDPRYLKIDGKPVFTVYRADQLPDMKATAARWRAEARKLGYPDLYLIATNAWDFKDYEAQGFDALSQFPPHGINAPNIEHALKVARLRDGGRVRDYASVVKSEIERAAPAGRVHPGVMPGWDNSARRPNSGVIYHGARPDLFQSWLEHAMSRARANPEGERLVFINAWNEWAEAAYLEPDLRYGYGYLAACAAAVRKWSEAFAKH
jgi:lipopolysaccharide biosynthesis protein